MNGGKPKPVEAGALAGGFQSFRSGVNTDDLSHTHGNDDADAYPAWTHLYPLADKYQDPVV